MDEASSDPRVGTVLEGRYRVLMRLAEGSMGVVYRGERLQLGRSVAIKFLRASYAAEPEFLQRFEREARAMSRLGHPHCVSVIDFGVSDAPYVVMDYVTGTTLAELLDRGRLPPPRALHIIRQVLAGLAHAHGQGIVHRDIKASNVMLTEATGTGDFVRLLDFGLAKLRDHRQSDLSSAQIVVGTPSYMAPEQTLAEPADARSDVYSVGILLFELLTGRKPFRADETFDLLRMHRDEPAPSLSEAAGVDFAPALEQLVAKALAKDPDDRYQSAIEFSAALDAVADAATSAGRKPELAFAPTESLDAVKEPRRRRWPFLVLILVLAGGGFAAAKLLHDRRAASAERAAPSTSADQVAPASADAPSATAPAAELADPAEPAAALADASLPDAAPVDAAPNADAAPLADASPGADALLMDEVIVADAGPEDTLPLEEQDEPVPAVAEEAGEPVIADAPPEESAPEPPQPVRNLRDVKELIAQGKRAEAIRGLHKLRRSMPRSAYVPYLLGNLYFERRWWTDGIEQYRAAIRLNRAYRKKAILNKNLVRALGSNKTSGRTAWTFENLIGWAAVPHLRHAADHDKNPVVRRRAAWLVKKITKPKRKRRRR